MPGKKRGHRLSQSARRHANRSSLQNHFRRPPLSFERLEDRRLLAVYLVKDINPGVANSSTAVVTEVSGTLFFRANDGTHGSELWKTDGTEEGTVMVKDIRPGAAGGGPSNRLTNVNGSLFFRANDGTHGWELWKTDGTEAGTVMVKDIRPGTASGMSTHFDSISNMNGTLFFRGNDGIHGDQLWKSDGTEAGTVMVTNLESHFFPINFTNVNGTLFFSANDGTHGYELWKSDGTEAGTFMVKDIQPGSAGSSTGDTLTNVNGTLFFRANDGTHGHELWKSDGTEAGTVLVKDIRPGGAAGLLPGVPPQFTNVNGTLFFRARDDTHGRELWKSDGTKAGTVMVKDIQPGSTYGSPSGLTNVNGTLFFSANDGSHGAELWKTDGTEAGTVMVKDIRPGSQDSTPGRLTNINGTLYFRANDGINSDALWKSDGTEDGTVIVAELWPGADPNLMHILGDRLLFLATHPEYGREWFALDLMRPAKVIGSHVYHAGSSFVAGGIDAALDTTKSLARESDHPQALSYDNLINSSRGINALVFDIDNLPQPQLTIDDFQFQVSPTGVFDQQEHPPGCWESAPAPSSIVVQEGSPSRVVIQWPDNAIANRWLRVTILANDNTGLREPHVYYLGHLLGETTGLSSGDLYTINFVDIAFIRDEVGNVVDASSIHDIDKNGTVTFADISAMRSAVGLQLTNITIPAAGSSSCPGGAELMYSGIGSSHIRTGIGISDSLRAITAAPMTDSSNAMTDQFHLQSWLELPLATSDGLDSLAQGRQPLEHPWTAQPTAHHRIFAQWGAPHWAEALSMEQSEAEQTERPGESADWPATLRPIHRSLLEYKL